MAGYGALQRYKMRQLYRKNKRLNRQVRSIRKFKRMTQDLDETKTGSNWSKAMYGESWKEATDFQKNARRAMRYYGAGDYSSFMKKLVPDGSFSYLGRTLGGMTGIPGMNAVGSWAGNKVSRFVGFGDYGSSANQIMGGANKGQISVNESDLTGDVYITQTEFIQNISCSATGAGASAFQSVAFPINPGLSTTFPFLSQIAQNYTLYDFEGLIFKFNPTSGENNATSNSLGKVIMAVNYDPNASDFVNSIQMENYDYANAAKPSQTILHGVETANHQQFSNMNYIRTGATSRDKIFTDLGTLFVATEGVPFAAAGTQILGELWVTYRIKLSRANLYGALLGSNISQDYISGGWPTSVFSAVPKSTNQIGCTVTNPASNTIRLTFPRNISLGSYMIVLQCVAGATKYTLQALNSASVTNGAYWFPGITLPQTGPTGAIGPLSPLGTTNNDSLVFCTWVTIQAPGSLQFSIDFFGTTPLTNSTTYRLFVSQVNQAPSLSLS